MAEATAGSAAMAVQQLAGNIMVVDDQPENLKLLEGMLKRQGYTVRSFPRGRLALASAIEHPPDLVLLDINMPEMSGYELCERLSCHERLSRIPVIFLSALDDVADKVRSFQAGGVDYIAKPFQFDEVQARIRTHLLLSELQSQVRQRDERIEELVRTPTRELAAANEQLKMLDRAKGDLLRLLARELRAPPGEVPGACQLSASAPCAHRLHPELGGVLERSRRRALALLDEASPLTEIEVGAEALARAPISLSSALHVACERVAELASSRGVTVASPARCDTAVLGAQELLEKALTASLETAVRLTPEGGSVRLSPKPGPERVQLEIESSGPHLPDAQLPGLFDLPADLESLPLGGALGLSPYVASRIVSLLRGTLTAQNRGEQGVRLTVSLKAAP